MRNDISPLPKLWDLPESIRKRLGREAGPQRSMYEEGHLLLILHEPPEHDAVARKAAFFWRSALGEWKSSLGAGLQGLNELLSAYEARLLRLESLEEVALTAAQYHLVLEEISPVLRAMRGVHKAVQQAREQVKEERELIHLRDRAAGLERVAELLLEDARFGLDYTVAKRAEEQAAAAQRMTVSAQKLNALAALTLPVTAITSVFGMNISSGLANKPEHFYSIVGLSLLLGVGLWLALRPRDH
jgi:hypothetical protein